MRMPDANDRKKKVYYIMVYILVNFFFFSVSLRYEQTMDD